MTAAKTCSNGHQMDPSWKVCPYCRTDQPTPSSAGAADEIVRENPPAPPAAPPPPPGASPHAATVREAPPPAALPPTVREAPPPSPAPAASSGDRKTMRMSLLNVIGRGWLVPLSGPQRGEVFAVDEGGASAGASSECTISIVNDFASGRHFRILFGEDGFALEDLRSTNGTRVNGIEVSRIDLTDGDRITIGKTDYAWKALVVDTAAESNR